MEAFPDITVEGLKKLQDEDGSLTKIADAKFYQKEGLIYRRWIRLRWIPKGRSDEYQHVVAGWC